MEDNNKDLTQDNLVDDLIQSLYGFSDEQLLKEFEEAEQDTTLDPNIQVYPDEFDRIWEDICAERAAEFGNEAAIGTPARKKRLSWKKVTAFALAAAFLTASFCFVAVGKKSYFYREKGGSENVVFDNDSRNLIFEEQEEAYELIEKELNIKPFRLGYIPEGMAFDSVKLSDRRAIIKYNYNNEVLYFVQSSDQTEASKNYISDGKAYKNVKNQQLSKEILVKREISSNGKETFEVQFANKDCVCLLYGIIDGDEFIKIVERIIY